jgi:hypothetical protein
MDIVGGAFGGSDPQAEFRATLETAKSWLEGVMSSWSSLSDERRLEMVAASLLSVNRLEMGLDALPGGSGTAPSEVRMDLPPERPNLVDLTLEERHGEATARVELEFRNETLVGESPCRVGIGRDHAAPARATLEALQVLLRDGLSLEDARVMQILDGPFAVVTLRSSDRLLVGSAMIEHDLGLAMARATLDAANRFISGMSRHDERTIQLT